MNISVFWFRRDLRIEDNSGLFHALTSGFPVLPVFIFDDNILKKLTDRADARVTFIYDTVAALKKTLQEVGSDLDIRYGDPLQIWNQLTKDYNIGHVFANHDYEPYANSRDEKVKSFLEKLSISFTTFKDHVIFEKNDVVKDDGKPYTVFTPYKNKWLEKLKSVGDDLVSSQHLFFYPSSECKDKFFKIKNSANPITLQDMGFERSLIPIPPVSVQSSLIKQYDKTRDFPAIHGTSRLGIHFRFGTISTREKAKKALLLNQTFLNELIWRDFYAMILFHFPYVTSTSFRKEYDLITWRNDENEFKLWCEGKTGYPIVDAGMRELAATGYMHNRVRMITASFLTKHLLIDWRWGEAWFAQKLLDYDLASNNGGWQWAAGCGTDAAPYFRIFSPDAQTDKFDHDKIYIKKWVPEFGTIHYPKPIVDHKLARERCLDVYKRGLSLSKH